jgi:hypothetical protein
VRAAGIATPFPKHLTPVLNATSQSDFRNKIGQEQTLRLKSLSLLSPRLQTVSGQLLSVGMRWLTSGLHPPFVRLVASSMAPL